MKKTIIVLAALLLCACASQDTAVPQSATEQTAAENETQEADTASQETSVSDSDDKQSAVAEYGVFSDELQMSAESGFYDEQFELEITAPEGCTIYYTTDGSEPDSTKTLYTKPILLRDRSSVENALSAIKGICPDNDYTPNHSVKKANVIRAAAVDGQGNVVQTMSRTFFVGIEKYDIPVISLITDPKNFFNKHDGIYVMGDTFDEWVKDAPAGWQGWQSKGNYSNRGREWERPVSMEYITADGLQLAQDCGVRIMGAASRSAAQKSMRLIAREDYGKKNFKYPLIPGNMRSDGTGEVDKYRSFVLRNGGNDCDFAKIRDPFLQSMVADTGLETMQYTPVIVYLDGEYWGMYSLAEDYSDHYIENNYSLEKGDVFDDDNVIFLKNGSIEDGEDEDIELFTQMYDFAVENDLNVPENYEKLSEMIDLDDFADYLAFNLYIHNSDSFFDDHNWGMWRVRKPDSSREKADGKWRMLVFDTDYSSGIYDGDEYHDNNVRFYMHKALPDMTDEEGNTQRHPLRLIRTLTDCPVFRNKLVTSLCDMRNICFERKMAVEKAVSVYDIYKRYVPDTFDRFGPEWVLAWGAENHYEGQIQNFANYLDSRYGVFPDMISEAFETGSSREIKISYDDTKGRVYLNGKLIPAEFSGTYFEVCSTDITVVPENGSTEMFTADSPYTKFDSEKGSVYRVEPEGDTNITISFD